MSHYQNHQVQKLKKVSSNSHISNTKFSVKTGTGGSVKKKSRIQHWITLETNALEPGPKAFPMVSSVKHCLAWYLPPQKIPLAENRFHEVLWAQA
jgi:hypothetical protein